MRHQTMAALVALGAVACLTKEDENHKSPPAATTPAAKTLATAGAAPATRTLTLHVDGMT